VQAVLFDLDGTLLDTVADIALALNRALAERQLRPLAVATVRDSSAAGAHPHQACSGARCGQRGHR
jgi:phosphoglycolate phosphatase